MALDFSKFHQPIGDLFASALGSDPDRFELSQAQLDQYEEDGFLPNVRVLDETHLVALRDELSELMRPGHDGEEFWYEYHSNESPDPSKVLFHALGAWRLRAGLHDILWHPAFTVAARQLLGGPVRFWHDQLFCKPPQHGGVVSWHQDYSYWTRTQPVAHLTCWIGLDRSTHENGCLMYVPGSHRWNLLPITGLAGKMDSIRQVLSDSQWEQLQNPVAVEMEAGCATFHHPFTVHGSGENKSMTPRRAIVINVIKDGVCSQSSEPLLEGVAVVPPGEPLSGQFFPLLRP